MVEEVGLRLKSFLTRVVYGLTEHPVVELVAQRKVVLHEIIVNQLCQRKVVKLSLIIGHVLLHHVLPMPHDELHEHALHLRLLLAVFAFSFFGWFEIKLPDSWETQQLSELKGAYSR